MDMIQDLLYHPIKLSSIFLITILPALGFALMMYNMVIALPWNHCLYFCSIVDLLAFNNLKYLFINNCFTLVYLASHCKGLLNQRIDQNFILQTKTCNFRKLDTVALLLTASTSYLPVYYIMLKQEWKKEINIGWFKTMNKPGQPTLPFIVSVHASICYHRVFLRCFRDPIWVSRISNQVPRIRENYHRVPKVRKNRVPRIRQIGSLQIHTGYLTFSLKKTLVTIHSYLQVRLKVIYKVIFGTAVFVGMHFNDQQDCMLSIKRTEYIWTWFCSVYGKKSFLSTESDTKILQSIYFAYKVGIISSYSNTTEKIKYVQCTIEKIGSFYMYNVQ